MRFGEAEIALARRAGLCMVAVFMLGGLPLANAEPAPSLGPTPAAVRARLGRSRPLLERDGSFLVDLNGATAQFDAGGATIAGPAGDRVHIQTLSIGREGGMSRFVLNSLRQVCMYPTMGPCVPSVQQTSGDVTQWWVALDSGVEQGWVINSRPAGAGPLVLDVAVRSALARPGSPTEPLAWDATGALLATELVVSDGGFRLLVGDQGAIYPVVVDPLYDAGVELGGAIWDASGAGDVDGDGYDDALLSYWHSSGAAIFVGSPDGLREYTWELLGAYEGRVAAAADFNGDGYDDVLVSGSGAIGGVVCIFLGSPSGPANTPDTQVESTDPYFGWQLVGAGDVDADGYADVLVASDSSVYLYGGSSDGLLGSGDLVVGGREDDSYTATAGGGDLDGDGFDDVALGGPGDDDAGSVDLYYGSVHGLAARPDRRLSGEAPGDEFGASVALDGDVDGDGYDDVVVGAPGFGGDSGRVYLFRGSAEGVMSRTTSTLTGEVGTYLGVREMAGDIDADGYDDVLLGDYRPDDTTNDLLLYQGFVGGLAPLPATSLSAGYRLFLDGRAAGDVDGDGFGDIVYLESASWLTYSTAGWYRGYAEPYPDADGDGLAANHDCDDADATVGPPENHPVDADGDGVGSVSTIMGFCPGAAGYSDVATDCDDRDAAVNPSATELCNAVDDNCDGVVDTDAVDETPTTRQIDADGDTYGGPDAELACPGAAGYSDNADDCDDTNVEINPVGVEICNGVDDDCDGLADSADSEVTGTVAEYVDGDGDAYGSTVVVMVCAGTAGYSDNADDCDDTTASVNPAAPEICNRVDDDCDGLVDMDDPGVGGAVVEFVDADGDGYGSTEAEVCAGTAGYADNPDDCDDTDPSVYPGATEILADGIDQDCDGADGAVEGKVPGCGCATPVRPGGAGFGGGVLSLGLMLLGLILRRRPRGAG